MSDPLVEWLRAAIGHRLKIAREAAGPTDGVWEIGHGSYDRGAECEDGDACVCEDVIGGNIKIYPEGGHNSWQAEHIAVCDPRDVIARCEVELAIVAEHAAERWYTGWRCLRCVDVERSHIAEDVVHKDAPCRTVRLLAWGHRHMPGYAEVAGGWKP